jgi:hypothetical protein
MTGLDWAWIAAFCVCIVALTVLCSAIKRFISRQPSGHLSSYVCMVQDIFVAVQARQTNKT